MTPQIAIIIAITLYKLGSLCVGLFSIYMGYKLFMAGIWGQSGDLTAEFRENKLILKKAAPGTFFALFGTAIVLITLWKGLEFDQYGSVATAKDVPVVNSAWDDLEEKTKD